MGASPGSCARTGPHNDLTCPTGADAAFEPKGLFGELSNQTAPPDKSRSPGGLPSPEVPNEGRLSGTIEKINTAAAENGKPQRFCSAACRKASQRPSAPTPQRPNVGENIGKDVEKDVGGEDCCPTDRQSVSGWPPKPTGHRRLGTTAPIKTYHRRKVDVRIPNPLRRANFVIFVSGECPSNAFTARSWPRHERDRERLSATLAILTADGPAESCASPLLPARGAAS